MAIHVNALTPLTVELRLDNPGRHNAMTLQDWLDAEDAIATLERNQDIRTLIVTGANRSFCAGADRAFLHQLQVMTPDERRSALAVGSRLVKALIRFPGHTIAAVDGPAVGIGASLALACDQVVATERSRFGLIFTSLGLPAGDMAASWLVARRAGSRAANTLFAQAAVISANSAAQLRLVDDIVDDLDCTAIARAADLHAVRTAPNAAAVTKQQLLEIEGAYGQLDEYMAAQLEDLVTAVGGPDFDAALTAQVSDPPVAFARRVIAHAVAESD